MSTEQFIDAEREDKWSASSAERVHYCAGSPQLIASLPPEARSSSSEVAESGTRIHGAWEKDDISDLDMTESEIKSKLDELTNEAYSKWQEDILVPRLGPELGRCLIKAGEHKEQRYWIFDEDLNKITSAKIDVAYFAPPFALIIDGKTGFKETTAAHKNFQCKVQAVAVAEEFPYITHVRVAIAAHRFKSILTLGDYLPEDITRAKQEILWDDYRSKQPDAARVPGSWCQYCPAKAWCPEAAALALIPSRRMVGSQNKALIAAYVDSLTTKDLAFIEKRRLMATNLFEAVKARLKSLPAEELASVGFELSEGANQLEVLNANGVVDTLITAGLLKEEEVISVFKLNNGALEELVIPRVQAKTPGLNQLGAKNMLRGMLQEAGHIVYDNPKNRKAPSLKEKA